jgi:hypothetical protein
MRPKSLQESQTRALAHVSLFVAGALLFGCGPEGAGSIHIPPRNKFADTRTGQPPQATASPGSRATPGNPLPRPNTKNSGQKKH